MLTYKTFSISLSFLKSHAILTNDTFLKAFFSSHYINVHPEWKMPTYCLQSVSSNWHPVKPLAEDGGGEGFDKEGWIRLVTVRKEITNENQATVFKYCIPQLTVCFSLLSCKIFLLAQGKKKKKISGKTMSTEWVMHHYKMDFFLTY